MTSNVWMIVATTLGLAALGLLAARKPLRGWLHRRQEQTAFAAFRRYRETLEAKFFDLAAGSGKPRGLRWVEIDWLDSVKFARDRKTGLLTAFAAINIQFEAIAGSDMEDVAAVGNIRDAAAVFHYEHGTWGTGGKALFNMNPADALVRLQGQFEPVGS